MPNRPRDKSLRFKNDWCAIAHPIIYSMRYSLIEQDKSVKRHKTQVLTILSIFDAG